MCPSYGRCLGSHLELYLQRLLVSIDKTIKIIGKLLYTQQDNKKYNRRFTGKWVRILKRKEGMRAKPYKPEFGGNR